MRLQLNVGALLFLGTVMVPGASADAPGAAATEPAVKVDSRSGVYQDDNATTIVTSTTAASAAVGAGLRVDARYLLDVISSASVDVTSAATARFHENRHEAATGLSWQGNEGRSASVSYIYSQENDWWSHTVNAGGSLGFLSQNLIVSGGVGLVQNQVGRQSDPNFSEKLDVIAVNLAATYNVSPKTLAQLSLFASSSEGFQSSPYRFVRLESRTALPENHPHLRKRAAVSLRINRHFFTDSVLQINGRVYSDDWGVRSTTGGIEWLTGFQAWTLGTRVRGYSQTGAQFFQDIYDQPMRYMSADRELTKFHDVFAGARLRWERSLSGFVSQMFFETKVDVFRFWFPEFHRLPGRDGFVAELALGVSF